MLSKKENQLPQALVEVHFLKDEIILEEGEIRNSFYISYDGQVDGPHQYAIVSTLSPAIPMVVLFTAITCRRGKLIARLPTQISGLWGCSFARCTPS